jgi:transmembrane sensor
VSLSTKFNVKAYPGEGGIRTMLDEGELELTKGGKTLSLTAGESAILDSNGDLRLDDKPTGAGTSWKDSKFYFSEQPVGPIMESLSRWYDVAIVYRGGTPPGPFRLKGFRNQSLKDLLDQLHQLGDFNYQIKADTVFVSR